jgi:hypothetical protein
MIACASALEAKEGTLWTLSKSATTILVRAVAANWNFNGVSRTLFSVQGLLADIMRVAVNIRFRG